MEKILTDYKTTINLKKKMHKPRRSLSLHYHFPTSPSVVGIRLDNIALKKYYHCAKRENGK